MWAGVLPQATWQTQHSSWLSRIANLTGTGPDARVEQATADLVETLSSRPDGVTQAMRRFGAALGSDGWHIEQVNAWIDELAALSRRHARHVLTSIKNMSALAEGWATEYVRGSSQSKCVDAITGLATPRVLILRLHEVFQHCALLDIDPQQSYQLLIVELSLEHLAPFERDAVLTGAAATITEVFHGGETTARAGERIFVLAVATEATAQRTLVLEDRLRSSPSTRAVPCFVWSEQLPATESQVDRYVSEFVAS